MTDIEIQLPSPHARQAYRKAALAPQDHHPIPEVVLWLRVALERQARWDAHSWVIRA